MRQDYSIYNEATMFTLHSSSYAGVPREELFERQEEVQEKGHLVRVPLQSDNGVCLRLVLDEALMKDESTAWVMKQEWHLYLPDGKLGLEGGLDARFTEEEAIEEEYLSYVDVPPGHYHVVIYTYLTVYDAVYALENSGNRERLGTYFRRTHPGKLHTDMPDWMQYFIGESWDADPGYEDIWEAYIETDAYDEARERIDSAENPLYVEFLAHLSPIADDTDFAVNPDWLEQVPFFGEMETWMKTTVRRPDICPTGIPANFSDDGDD